MWVQHGHGVRDQLEDVAIAGADQDIEAGLFGASCKGADHIVGFIPFLFHVGDVESLEHLLDQVELASEFVWRCRAVCLVFAVNLGAEGMTRDVEGNAEMGRLLVA